MNHESEALCKKTKFYYIFSDTFCAIPSKRMSNDNRGTRFLAAKEFFPFRVSGTIDFSLFTPIRRAYYLRAIDTSRCHRFSDIQRTDYKSRACKCAFYRADSSKYSSRRRLQREKCIRGWSTFAAFEALRRKSDVSSIK